jgi:hypothetical protein
MKGMIKIDVNIQKKELHVKPKTTTKNHKKPQEK